MRQFREPVRQQPGGPFQRVFVVPEPQALVGHWIRRLSDHLDGDATRRLPTDPDIRQLHLPPGEAVEERIAFGDRVSPDALERRQSEAQLTAGLAIVRQEPQPRRTGVHQHVIDGLAVGSARNAHGDGDECPVDISDRRSVRAQRAGVDDDGHDVHAIGRSDAVVPSVRAVAAVSAAGGGDHAEHWAEDPSHPGLSH